MADETVLIRRYPNRRLYDRSQRCYVTLQDVESMVRSGRTVEVQDSRTGEDITRQVLTQILLERHPEKMDLFPVAMLHSLLQANDLVMDFWRGCLRQSLAALEGWQQHGALATPFGWMSTLFPFSGPRGHASAPPAPTPDPDPELARRLALLETRIHRLEGNPDPEPEPETGHAPDPPAEQLQKLERRVRGLERPAAKRKRERRKS